jgi:hypothetical protein
MRSFTVRVCVPMSPFTNCPSAVIGSGVEVRSIGFMRWLLRRAAARHCG